MARNKQDKTSLRRLELTSEAIRYETLDRRAAAVVGLHPNHKSITWSAEQTTTEKKVAIIRPFLDIATDAEVIALYDEKFSSSEKGVTEAKNKLDSISKLGAAVTHFSLDVYTPKTDWLRIHHNYIEPNSHSVSINAKNIEPEYIHDLFLESATIQLRPHFDEIVADFRQHIVTEPKK